MITSCKRTTVILILNFDTKPPYYLTKISYRSNQTNVSHVHHYLLMTEADHKHF